MTSHSGDTEQVESSTQSMATARQTALTHDVALALARDMPLREMLQTCTQAIVDHLDGAFARIWTLNTAEHVLELQASAGMYTHLDGVHGQVPVGELKIGRIASRREPHLTNAVVGDPNVGDQEWAQREGMVAFAGYPLLIESRVVGVVAMFSRHALSRGTLEELAAIAPMVATGIERKQMEEALREERETLEIVNQVGQLLTAELELEKIVQAVTDAATRLTGAGFGAFFYNVIDERGESFMLYALSGVSREYFENFPMPRNTAIFGPTFRGEGVVRLADVRADPRYGKSAPFHGLPAGHLLVVSYLAVSVISRSGEVLGGLFFGHSEPGVFTERAEKIAVGLASYTAIAIDNARLYQQAQDATRLRDDFLLSVSHDLKTPLTVLRTQSQLLQRRLKGADIETLRDGLRVIEDRTRTMNRYLDELVDVARLRAGSQIELDRQPTDLNELVDAVVNTITRTARQRVEVNTEGEALIGHWDATRLTRVLDNLLNNAAKYSSGDSTITVNVARVDDAAGTCAAVVVRDAGVGIPAEDLPRIFERFYRASNASQTAPGSGLGLAGAKWIVEQHGGSIELQSEEGAGTTVTVRLPLVSEGRTIHLV